MEVIECHTNVWKGIEDKSQIATLGIKLSRLISWFFSYPSLVWRYLHLPRHDIVIVGYMGQLDILILWPFARLRSVPIVWDAYLSLYDTVVNDRKIVSKHSPLAWLLYSWEWLACLAANKIFLDTKAHALYFENLFHLTPGSIDRVFVGAETDVFSASSNLSTEELEKNHFTVLFYGQFIPLHGIDNIVEAAKKVEQSGNVVRWIIIGEGQEKERIDALIRNLRVKSIERVPWVPYDQLAKWIRQADVCLGIFGTSGKAERVIPNKVFQVLAINRPLITADTPAIRELFERGHCPYIHLVPNRDAEALASTVLRMKSIKYSNSNMECESQHVPVIGQHGVGIQLKAIIESII